MLFHLSFYRCHMRQRHNIDVTVARLLDTWPMPYSTPVVQSYTRSRICCCCIIFSCAINILISWKFLVIHIRYSLFISFNIVNNNNNFVWGRCVVLFCVLDCPLANCQYFCLFWLMQVGATWFSSITARSSCGWQSIYCGQVWPPKRKLR